MLVDTNVWSELLRARPDEPVIEFIAENRDNLFLSTIVLAEMEFGVANATDPARQKQYRLFVDDLRISCRDRVLEPNLETARVWGAKKAELKSSPIADFDLLIASQAIAAGMPLVTRNISDMERTGAVIINPWPA